MTLLISRVLVILLALAVSVSAGDLDSQIKTLVETTPAARGALVGVLVVDLANGQTLAAHNPDHFFVPASNTKLFTTALALARLGSDYRFSTTVMSDRAPDASGTVGWLRLVGGGDPNLSNRTLPYQPGPSSGNPLQPIEELADQLVARGLRRVAGDVTGDDSAYVWAPYPEGWAVDDGIWDYGAPVNALVVNDNTFSLKVEPGARAGDPARLTPLPALEFYQIDNRVRTRAGGERKIWVDREPGSRQLRLWGYIPLRDPGETEVLGIEDPAWYAARALIDALSRRGVAVGGIPQAWHLYPNQLADLRQGQPAAPDTAVELARR
ncbi:MAG TPA: D-alanyl-D-alanine carboxypeptidase/D-alanyl-D-alanine-endopeptidase, partial [Bryobacteraceae bacterium]|nr:D-alanyl-D-alanine carboxypeptidase/D-alanyl-D-alanine-endopeptidase [Bryobacteraceae bacterium]